VADNASTDDSIAFLQQHFPQVLLIHLRKNFGFAKGYNEALKQLKEDYYLLLNSDVEVTPGWIDPMIALLEEKETHAACAPKLLDYHKRNFFEYAGGAGGWIDLYGYPFARGRVFDICEEDRGQYNNTTEVFWATGAALLIKSRVFHLMDGFDEYFFAHQEEIDLCWRIRHSGHKVFSCPASEVFHVGGGTLPKGNSRKTFLNFRNNQILLAKNLALQEKWWKIPYRMMLDQVSALKGLFSGDVGYFVAIFRAHMAFFGWLLFQPKHKSARRKKLLKELPGVYQGNVVWAHFIQRKNSFSEIVGK
jgi:GT2 family glycosyltransferase